MDKERGSAKLLAQAIHLKRVDVEQVDYINVVQSHLQTSEEAGPLGCKLLLV